MKVLLVNAASPTRDLDHSTPLGIMSLGAYLRSKEGVEVRLCDMQIESRKVSAILSSAIDFHPDIIGISGMTIDSKAIDQLSRNLKAILPSVPIIVGGAQATHNPQAVMRNPCVDYVISGEGEVGLSAFVQYIRGLIAVQDVPNLVYRANGGLHQNPHAPYIEDLDSLPFPAHDSIDMEKYFALPHPCFIYARKRYAVVMTSRGCPFGCAYCHIIHGRKYRYRGAENVVAEIRQLAADHAIGEIVILDDLFNLIPERVNRIAELIIASGLDIKLNIPTGLRGDIMTEEGLRLLKKAGLYRCLFAIDTASPRLQKMTGRNCDVEKTLRMIELASDLGILVHGTFIIGFPTETEYEARWTIQTAFKSKIHTVAFHRAIPFRGTALYRLAEQRGARLSVDDEHFDFNKDSSALNASSIADKTLIRMRRRAYRRFYLSPLRVWRLFRLLPNKRILLPTLFMLWIRKAFTGVR